MEKQLPLCPLLTSALFCQNDQGQIIICSMQVTATTRPWESVPVTLWVPGGKRHSISSPKTGLPIIPAKANLPPAQAREECVHGSQEKNVWNPVWPVHNAYLISLFQQL